jgi:hypothetical protein
MQVSRLQITTSKSSHNYTASHFTNLLQKSISLEKMAAPPAVTAHILRNFSIAFVGIVARLPLGLKSTILRAEKNEN